MTNFEDERPGWPDWLIVLCLVAFVLCAIALIIAGVYVAGWQVGAR